MTDRNNIVGDPLFADKWISSGTSAAVEYIDFGEGQLVAEPAERFETAWTGIDDFKTEFLPGFVDLDPFIVNTGGDADTTETFDFWVDFVFDLARLELFKFTSETLPVEDFEPGWGNDNAIFEFEDANLLAADFGGFSNSEDFEQGWKNDDYKEAFLGIGTDLDAAAFTELLAPNDFENFEQVENSLVRIEIVDAQSGESYEVNINQRALELVSATTDETVLRDLIVSMINNSPEPVTTTPDGVGSFFIADDVLPTTSIIGVDGPADGAGPSIVITDVVVLGSWSQTGLIEGFVDV